MKEKLKPIIDKFCMERGLKPVSVSTIGGIIRYLIEREGVTSRRGKREIKLLYKKLNSWYPKGNVYIERF